MSLSSVFLIPENPFCQKKNASEREKKKIINSIKTHKIRETSGFLDTETWLNQFYLHTRLVRLYNIQYT